MASYSHLSEQRSQMEALVAAAKEVVQEIEAAARDRRTVNLANPAPSSRPKQSSDVLYDVTDECRCHDRRNPPCSWCTSTA